MVCILLFSS